jgi:hypothetical protein
MGDMMREQRQEDPSPNEIRERCLEIQAGWSDDERMKRLRCDLRPYFTRCDGQREEFDADDYETHHEQRAAILEGATLELD